ncbi:aminotransferase class I/II-fold pyridoxal phosphate-dependent enzyme [bacterium]|nr:aminotransferase class I/II-fold pyridoxal phosphate-dependent enzyme [bacterium]
MKVVDLRSDTVTRPDRGMLDAMMQAEVGDDVFNEDPTVLLLQEMVADLLGKDEALFVPSGTMSNQIAVALHTRPGDEVLLEAGSHIRNYESGAAAALWGVQLCPVSGKRGILAADDVIASIRTGYEWEPVPRLLCVENTNNKAGGTIYPLDRILELGEVAKNHGLGYHLDGARIWNASVATGVSEKEIAAPFDTVSVCLSKGLGTPLGSVLSGNRTIMERARRIRKRLGGGMRQVGIVAAAGIYAIQNNRASLSDDHKKASVLATGLSSMKSVTLDIETVETNIVVFDLNDGRLALDVLQALSSKGIRMIPFGPKTIRATTHRDVTMSDIELALDVAQTVLT